MTDLTDYVDEIKAAMDNQHSFPHTRPFSLSLYLLVVFSLSWPFQIVSTIWASEILPRYILNGLSMVMVTLGTFVAGRYIFRDGFADAKWQWGRPKFHLAVVSLALLLWAIPACGLVTVGALKVGGWTEKHLIWILVFLFVTPIPAFGEEFGWRGYMLPRMARRWGDRKAVILHAIIWWAWHLPIIVGTGVEAGIGAAKEAGLPIPVSIILFGGFTILLSAIPSILHGVVVAYIWARSGSIAVATTYHAAYDGIRDSTMIIWGLFPGVGLWANALLTFLGIVFLCKGDWRNISDGCPRQPNDAPT